MLRQAKRYPDLLSDQPETAGLADNDAGLADVIYDASVRRWLTLSALIERAGERPMARLEPVVRASLLAGAAQIVLLDRVPAYAAVGESVAFVKSRGGRRASGLVNAILRKLADAVEPEARETWTDRDDEVPLSDGRARGFARAVLPDDAVSRLEAQTSVPVSLIARWTRGRDTEAATQRALHALARPPIVLHTAFAEHNVADTAPHDADGHAVYTGGVDALRTMLAARGDIWVQDAASAEPIRLAQEVLGRDTPGRIVDLCAGVGTKTRQLAAAFPGAQIVASDPDTDRFETLTRAFAGHERVRVVGSDALLGACLGWADLVVLDVPCTNSGVLPRRPGARYRVGRSLQRLVDTQRQILADAQRLRSAGGSVLYATCSLEPEENDRQAAWSAKWHGLSVVKSRATEPRGLAGGEAGSYRDGGFAAVLRPIG